MFHPTMTARNEKKTLGKAMFLNNKRGGGGWFGNGGSNAKSQVVQTIFDKRDPELA